VRLVQTDVFMVINTDTDEVAGVYPRKQRTRATNEASSLYHGDGGRWVVIEGKAQAQVEEER
jgi:hypothetical protein